MERNELIKFGIFHESSTNHDSTDITSACVVDNDSFIITTVSKVIKMNRSLVLDTAPMQFSHTVYVEKYQLVIAVSIHLSNLFIFPSTEIGRPLIANFPTTQRVVSCLIYSPKSESIITIGDKIKVWNLNVIIFSKMIRPTVSIAHSHTFKETFNISSYQSIGFDTDKEILYLPTPEGILPYTIQGEALPTIAKASSNISTIFSYSNGAKELLLSDRSNGLSIWSNIGTFVKRIPFGGSYVSYMAFIDDENVIIVDDENAFYLLNIKSNRSMLGLTMNRRPLSVFYINTEKPRIFVAFEDHYEIYAISIPWKVWSLNVIRPILTKTIPKKSSMPRFLVQTTNSFAKIYSPKDGKPITAATPSCAAFPVSIYYDRGQFIYYTKNQFGPFIPQTVFICSNRENLIMNLDNEQTVIFDALTAPMKEISTLNLKTKHIFPCFFDDKWCYAIHADIGEISIIDYNCFNTIERFKLTNTSINNFFYHYPTNSIIVMYSSELIRFSLTEKVILGRIQITIQSTFSELFSDSIFIGDKTGKIHKFNIDNETIISKDVNEINGHLTAVSNISFSPSFMISSSFDGAVVVWDYSFNKIAQITSPLPIFSCCFLNGNRDIILGTETELMIMKGELIFNGDKDPEFDDIDNFNKNSDTFITNDQIELNLNNGHQSLTKEAQKSQQKEKTKGRSLYRERIEKLKQKVEEMNKDKEEKEKQLREKEKLAKEGKLKMDENEKRRIIDQMLVLTNQTNDESTMLTLTSIQFQPQKPQIENTNNPRLNQNQNQNQAEEQAEVASRSSSRSSKSVSVKESSESDEETIKKKGKDFLKKSIVKDEKIRHRKEKRSRRLKEKQEKEKQRKELLEKLNSMKKIEKQKTEQEILLESMDTTLTIEEIPPEKPEPEPEIFFRQPSFEKPPQISRPIRKAASARRFTPAELKEKFENDKKIVQNNKANEEEENYDEDDEKKGKKLKNKKKKKSLNKRLKRAPTPPEVRKNSNETKEPKKKKRSKTLPMLGTPPKVVDFNPVEAVVDSDIVQEVFSSKKDLEVKLPDKPSDNRAPIRNSNPNLVDEAIEVNSMPDEKVELETVKDDEILNDKNFIDEAVEVNSFRPQPPPPPPPTPSSVQSEIENTKFEVKPPTVPKHKGEELANKPPPDEQDNQDGQFYLTQVQDGSKLRKMLNSLVQFEDQQKPPSATSKTTKKREITFREIERKLKETEEKLEELEQQREVDPLAWRGVPPKLEKMKVIDIDFFDDDQNDYSQNLFIKGRNRNCNSNIRNKRRSSSLKNSSSSCSSNSSKNANLNIAHRNNDDPSALGFLSNWSARKAQRSRRIPSSTRRSKVSRVDKSKPWM